MVVEGAREDAQQLGDRGDGAAGAGQQVAAGADDFLGGDARTSADPAALVGGGRALVGADDDEFADELGQGGEEAGRGRFEASKLLTATPVLRAVPTRTPDPSPVRKK
ncbi:hypothetical protein AB1388_13430 [Streptomyces hydrogenans]|uniref:hypothetical protein n=1 Tax=Streptomyces hydrogenans TaxID=1873719 RepID=UPI00345D8C08